MSRENGRWHLNRSNLGCSRSAWGRSNLLLLALLVACGGASAQEHKYPQHLSQEETIELVSQTMADIQSAFPTIDQASTLEPAVVKNILVRATSMVLELRDDLLTNNYLRVASFSVDFPSGVTVQFSFPPIEDKGE